MFFSTAVLISAFTGAKLYLDPGSGSILIQFLIAAVAAAGIFFATSWRRIKKIFHRKSGESDAAREEDEDDD
jgi:hypothetical protein